MTTREKIIGEIRAFNRFYINIIGVLDNHILNSDYSLTEARILFEICNNDNCTARTIKNIIKIDEGYLSRIIDKLVKQKLIKKQQSKVDGRVYILILTSFGEKQFQKLNDSSFQSVKQMIEKLTAAETEHLINHMRGIKELLTKSFQ